MQKPRFYLKRDAYTVRHFQTAARHITPAKVSNVLLNNYELRQKRHLLKSKPYFIKVEPSPFCHLRCPGCLHGNHPEMNRVFNKSCMMSFDQFAAVIEPLKKVLLGVSLSVRGEPLINPHTLKMVKFCHENNIGTTFPTNFSLRFKDEEFDEMVASGLDHLMISIDGITQEVYSQYRVGGNLELVLSNAEKLIRAKRGLKSKTPSIEFKFIIFDHNRHQAEEAEKLANRIGFDKFSLVAANRSEERLNASRQIADVNRRKRKACYWPWNNLVVFWDGSTAPCCTRYFPMDHIGKRFEALWNGEKYQSLRKLFSSESGESEFGYEMCSDCMMF